MERSKKEDGSGWIGHKPQSNPTLPSEASSARKRYEAAKKAAEERVAAIKSELARVGLQLVECKTAPTEFRFLDRQSPGISIVDFEKGQVWKVSGDSWRVYLDSLRMIAAVFRFNGERFKPVSQHEKISCEAFVELVRKLAEDQS